MKKTILILYGIVAVLLAHANTNDIISVTENSVTGTFPLSRATIYTDNADYKVVGIAAAMLADDAFQTSLTNGTSTDLCFDGLDTYADVYLNDSLIIKADNMFRRWRTNVSSILRKGDNKLRVYLHSLIKVDIDSRLS